MNEMALLKKYFEVMSKVTKESEKAVDVMVKRLQQKLYKISENSFERERISKQIEWLISIGYEIDQISRIFSHLSRFVEEIE